MNIHHYLARIQLNYISDLRGFSFLIMVSPPHLRQTGSSPFLEC